MQYRANLLLALLGAGLVSCGLPGAPQPPSLQLPRPVDDLAAWRKGDKVHLSWTAPQKTTDGQNIRSRGLTRICRAVNTAAMAGCKVVAEVAPPASSPNSAALETAGHVDVLPSELQRQHPTGFATYAVEVLNANGRSAGLSNQGQVPLTPTLPPPDDLKAEVTPEAIVLTWSAVADVPNAPPLRYLYRVYRRDQGSETGIAIGELPLAGTPRATFVDRNFEWEKTYVYEVAAVTVVPSDPQPIEVEGEDSAPLPVTPRDSFAPATPSGVQAVFSGVGQPLFIDLTWAPNMERDVAGYNVYRQVEGEAPSRINRELVKTPSFRDSDVLPGATYLYSITAVDLRGNESGRSEPASESVPPKD